MYLLMVYLKVVVAKQKTLWQLSVHGVEVKMSNACHCQDPLTALAYTMQRSGALLYWPQNEAQRVR